MSELLCPAGDMERLRIAFIYGADAVYIGGKKYGLRANGANFTNEEILEAVKYAHLIGKKLYVTVNIVFHDKDILGLKDYLIFLSKAGVDAVIVSDPAVVNIINEENINLNIHLSTQASTLNSRAVKFYQSLGVKRFVLAREASKDNIIRIKEETGAELECFISGAMCTSFSGRCVLSNYLTNRDSNRGGCAQACRWIYETDDIDFTMMSKDLNMIKNLASMKDIGVNSFKIEGRMKSIYYIATVVHSYRSVLNKIRTKTLTEEYINYVNNIINRVANRESAPAFYDFLPGVEEEYFDLGGSASNQDFLGVVKSYNSEFITVEVRNYFEEGTKAEIFGPHTQAKEFVIDEIYNEEMERLHKCNNPLAIVKIKCPFEVEENSMIRVKIPA